MVPKSRLSIPLIAAFILVLASYLVYLTVAKNIFRVPLIDQYFHPDSILNDGQQPAMSGSLWAHFFNKKNDRKTPLNVTSTEVIVDAAKKADEPIMLNSIAPDSTKNVESAIVSQPAASTNTSAMPDVADTDVSVASVTWTPTSRGQELQLLWRKYSDRVPPLYSASLNKSTEEILGRVAQISANLDQRYIDDKSDWINHLEEVHKELIDIAVAGEREGVRALSFQYVHPPLNKTVEALTWAMIANAISPNDYYLYICSDEFSLCSEGLFDQASAQAKSYSDIYHFLPAPQPANKK